ncbi:hypothetical protein SK128_025044, partial [Halocaridina rubra]
TFISFDLVKMANRKFSHLAVTSQVVRQVFQGKQAKFAGGSPKEAKILISNLDAGVTDEDMNELFQSFGHLKEVSVHYNSKGASLGKAHVVFARQLDAVKALKTYDGVKLDGRQMNITMVDQTGQTSSIAKTSFSVHQRLSTKVTRKNTFRSGRRTGVSVSGQSPAGKPKNITKRLNQRPKMKSKFVTGTSKASKKTIFWRSNPNSTSPAHGTVKSNLKGVARGHGGKKINKIPTLQELDEELDTYIKQRTAFK